MALNEAGGTVNLGVSAVTDLRAETHARLQEALGFGAFARKRFEEDNCLRLAASLSYTSLLAIVPLTAIAFAMLTAFPVFEGLRGQIQEAVFSNLLPDSAVAARDYFDSFVENTTGLTAMGILGLAVTAILLLATIESALNTIFRVTQPRGLVPRLLVFWALITLGPLMLGASLSLSTYFFALTRFVGVEDGDGSIGGLAQYLPTLIIIVIIGLLYLIVPNRRIRVSDAAIGAVVAGVLFAGLRKVFGLYVSSFPTYQTIYGALSVMPIFLVWMYLSWAVVLLGAVLSAALGEWRTIGRRARGTVDAGERLLGSLQLLSLLRGASRRGRGFSRARLLRETGFAETVLERLLTDLDKAGFVDRCSGRGWVLIRDLETVSLYDLLRELGLTLVLEEGAEGVPAWRRRLTERLGSADTALRQAHAVTLKELLAEPEPDKTPSVAVRSVAS